MTLFNRSLEPRFSSTLLLRYLAKWLPLALLAGLLAGSASAFFLVALDWATSTRLAHRWLLWLLPLAGFAVGWLYLRFGRAVEAGNNLLIDQIHDPDKVIPLRMAPLVLIGTVLSHLCGASVGREGTAVQMGGTLADQLTHVFRLRHEDRRTLLMAGISAGFASVFGTPLAGAVFALEVLAIGRLRSNALFACLVAAIAGDRTCLLWGVHHTHYVIGAIPPLAPWPLLAAGVAGIAFGLAGRLFADCTHALGAWIKRKVAYAPLRPLLGAIAIALAAALLPIDHYLGLGIPTIQAAFLQPLAPWDFAAKLVLTVASLGSGFKGGEVTPLFYIGATLGNALAPLLHLPLGLVAGLGFVAVFAGAANTPLASTLMAIELFGGEIGVYAAVACVLSYLFSGHTGIYRAQRLGRGKFGRAKRAPAHLRLGELDAWRRPARSRDADRG
jgi:H+/Cl- antiporter ClcA